MDERESQWAREAKGRAFNSAAPKEKRMLTAREFATRKSHSIALRSFPQILEQSARNRDKITATI